MAEEIINTIAPQSGGGALTLNGDSYLLDRNYITYADDATTEIIEIPSTETKLTVLGPLGGGSVFGGGLTTNVYFSDLNNYDITNNQITVRMQADNSSCTQSSGISVSGPNSNGLWVGNSVIFTVSGSIPQNLNIQNKVIRFKFSGSDRTITFGVHTPWVMSASIAYYMYISKSINNSSPSMTITV